MTATQFQKMVNHDSGMLGVSGISSDVRELLEQEAGDVRAAEAVALFCRQAKKWIGSFAAALGGLDTLVFAGGLGQTAPPGSAWARTSGEPILGRRVTRGTPRRTCSSRRSVR
jgi:acetate kinase